MFAENVVAHDPRRNSDVYETELFPKEEWALDLADERPQRVAKLFNVRLLFLWILFHHQTHIDGNDVLGNVVDPNTNVRLCVWIVGQQTWAVRRVGVLEELAEDQGLVERLSLVLDGRN